MLCPAAEEAVGCLEMQRESGQATLWEGTNDLGENDEEDTRQRDRVFYRDKGTHVPKTMGWLYVGGTSSVVLE